MAPIENISNSDSKMATKSPIPLMQTSLLSIQNVPLLFSQHFLKPIEFLHDFHAEISSNVHKYLKVIHFSTINHPLIEKIMSFSSHFRHFTQVQCRIARSVNPLSSHNFAAVLPGDSVAGVVVANGVLNFLNLYNTLLVVRLVLTWFPNTPPQIVSPLSTICDPYLNIFRGIIPPLGGTLDLSPILAFLVLNAFTSATSALPAELPPPRVFDEGSSLPTMSSDLTTSQAKWNRRLHGSKTSNPNGATTSCP